MSWSCRPAEWAGAMSGLGTPFLRSFCRICAVTFPRARSILRSRRITRWYTGTARDRLIVTIGMDDTVIVDTGDVLLVCKSDQAQKVREVVDHLKKHQQDKYL